MKKDCPDEDLLTEAFKAYTSLLDCKNQIKSKQTSLDYSPILDTGLAKAAVSCLKSTQNFDIKSSIIQFLYDAVGHTRGDINTFLCVSGLLEALLEIIRDSTLSMLHHMRKTVEAALRLLGKIAKLGNSAAKNRLVEYGFIHDLEAFCKNG